MSIFKDSVKSKGINAILMDRENRLAGIIPDP